MFSCHPYDYYGRSWSSTAQLDARPDEPPWIEVPISFHIQRNFFITKDGIEMDVWITPRQIIDILLPEVNRIWAPAYIIFKLNSIEVHDEDPTETELDALEVLRNADREREEQFPSLNAVRKTAIKTLSLHSPNVIPGVMNAFFLPYMGKTRQGNATDGVSTMAMGVWSDKFTFDPTKVLLTENPNAFVRGSLARTTAHELGHCFKLRHPKDANPDLLMGVRGYTLTENEIKTARSVSPHRTPQSRSGIDVAEMIDD